MLKDCVEIDVDEALDWELDGKTLRQALTDEAESRMFAMPSVAPEGHFEIRIALFVGHNPTGSPGTFMVEFKPD